MYIYIYACVIICLFIYLFTYYNESLISGEMTMNHTQFLTMAMRPTIFGEDVPTGPSGCG